VDAATFLVALWRALQAFLRALWDAVRQLGHQVAGVFFLVFAAAGAAALIREWGRWPASRLAIAAVFTFVFAWFAVSSFWRARKAASR